MPATCAHKYDQDFVSGSECREHGIFDRLPNPLKGVTLGEQLEVARMRTNVTSGPFVASSVVARTCVDQDDLIGLTLAEWCVFDRSRS